MKTLLPLLALLSIGWLTDLRAQTTVRLETEPCRGRVQVFGMNGVGYVRVKNLKAEKITKTEDGTEVQKNVFTWESPATKPKVYFIGTSMRDYFPVLVGVDAEVNATAECGKFRTATISGSPGNVAYHTLLRQLNQYNANSAQLAQLYNRAQANGDPAELAKQKAALSALDAQKLQLVEQTMRENPYLGRIAALNTYLSYPNADPEKYPTPRDHFVGTTGQLVDFDDPGYNDMNVVYEAAVGFARTLLTGFPPQDLEADLNAYVDRWPAGSNARLYAFGGLFGLMNGQRQQKAALAIGNRMLEEYGESHPQVVASMGKEFNKLRTSVPGTQAPELEGPSPSGETIRLSDLKGKVVLLDFWASWCGPCRRENPNVVRMYELFSDQGFEILSVSLDRDKGRWEKAIADDGMNWLHISDLKHWQSEYAALYGVRSIPDTVLLDEEGKIIARNLRGAQLEKELKKIFGAGK